MIKYHINSYNVVSQANRVDPEIEALVNTIDYDGDGVMRGRIDFLLDNGMKPITSDEMVLSDFAWPNGDVIKKRGLTCSQISKLLCDREDQLKRELEDFQNRDDVDMKAIQEYAEDYAILRGLQAHFEYTYDDNVVYYLTSHAE